MGKVHGRAIELHIRRVRPIAVDIHPLLVAVDIVAGSDVLHAGRVVECVDDIAVTDRHLGEQPAVHKRAKSVRSGVNLRRLRCDHDCLNGLTDLQRQIDASLLKCHQCHGSADQLLESRKRTPHRIPARRQFGDEIVARLIGLDIEGLPGCQIRYHHRCTGNRQTIWVLHRPENLAYRRLGHHECLRRHAQHNRQHSR